MITLTESDDGRAIEMRSGDAVQIRLPENATTGYRWAIDSYDATLFEQPTEEARYASGAAVGSGGEMTFAFKAKAPGKGEIALKNWRAWEGEAGVAKRFRIRVQIAK